MRRDTGEEHRTAALLSEQLDWEFWLMNWQQTGCHIAKSAVFLSHIVANFPWRGCVPALGLELGSPGSRRIQKGDSEQ